MEPQRWKEIDEFQMQFLKLEPRWDSVRSDRRFLNLTNRLRLLQ